MGEDKRITRDGALAVYLEAWLAHTRTRVRATTFEGYEGMIRRYVIPRIGQLPLDEVAPLDLQGLYSALLSEGPRRLSSGTVLNLHLVLTQALGQAVRWQILDRNPAAGAQPPRPRRAEPIVVDPPLAQRLLEAVVGSAYEVPATIALATGMRRGEILALRWSDLDP